MGMTNEEKLREIFPKTIFIYRKKDDKTTAIMCSDEWLNAEYKEPTTKNDLGVDAISRADVDAVIEQMRVRLKDGRMYILAEVVQDIIRELPSVTPQEPRKGHWMKSNIGGAKVCSVCNAHMGLSSFKFCPNCGADMREVEE